MAKLNVATFAGLQGISRTRLRRGVLHVDLTPGPKPWSAGHQPPNSGRHLSHDLPADSTLLQFPAEILKIILSFLEPIWLFQVAAAYPKIDSLLDFQTSNKIWYNAMPSALFLEPENFQDEMLVEDRMSAYSKGVESNTALQLSYSSAIPPSSMQSRLIDYSNKPFSDDAFYYNAIHGPRFVVPAITNLSELSTNLDISFDIVHPRDRRFYPTTPTRLRVMALGGPFQPWVDYRQELAGHLHYGVRCFICLEVVGRYRQYRHYWGLIWCSDCYNLYMLDTHRVAEIPGLDTLVKCCSHYSAVHVNEKPGNRPYRPMVDDILRQKIGLDFHTALAVQKYIRQLLETWKGGTQSEPLKAHRRKLRRDIVSCAQGIWDSTVLDKVKLSDTTGDLVAKSRVTKKIIIIQARQRWAPTSMLPKFLFPDRLLTDSNLWAPYDPNAQWLHDPTLDLETSRDVLRAGPSWIGRKAREMVQKLVMYGHEGGVTSWTTAAVEWHVRRLTRDLYWGKYLNFESGGKRQTEPSDVPTASNNRLDVLAKKLRIDPLFPVGALTDHEKKKAVGSFNKIILQRCTGCPDNNMLIFPAGLRSIVQHYCDHHAHDFFMNDTWTIRG